ncbi:D-hydantoinase [archaeon HR01]|nr:D-hydantoinase [archaeon HR01]
MWIYRWKQIGLYIFNFHHSLVFNIMFDLVIKDGNVVTADGVFKADIAVDDGKIVQLARKIEEHSEKVIDASGLLVLPGGIDGHTHFQLNYNGVMTADDFYTGTVAAAFGGITTVIDFVTPSSKSYIDEFLMRRGEAEGRAVVDFGLHFIVTDVSEERLKDLEVLAREYGVSSFKIFTAYRRRGLMLDDGSILELMKLCRALGALLLVHCENEEMINRLVDRYLSKGCVGPEYHALSRPAYVEAEAVRRVGFMAGLAGCRVLVVHLSSGQGLEAVKELKRSGVRMYVETCPHYLVFSDEVYRRPDGAKFIMSPPLKGVEDRRMLWEGVSKGVIDVVGSDHACFNSEQKLRPSRFTEIPGGVAGVEHIIPVLYTLGVRRGLIGLADLVRLTSYNPARIYGLYPSKGTLMPGSQADIVIFNPSLRIRLTRENLHSNLDHSIYEDITAEGHIQHTIVRGELVVEDRQFVGRRGHGKYIQRQTENPPTI